MNYINHYQVTTQGGKPLINVIMSKRGVYYLRFKSETLKQFEKRVNKTEREFYQNQNLQEKK